MSDTVPPIRVVAAILVRGRALRATIQTEYFLQQRTKGEYVGRWEIPGGKLEPGERPLKGLQRELDEELGLILYAMPLTEVYRTEHDGPRGPYEVQSYACRLLSDVEITPREGQAVGWYTYADALAFDLTPATRVHLDIYAARHSGPIKPFAIG